MIKRFLFISVFLVNLAATLVAQSMASKVPETGDPGYCIMQDEMILYNLINDLRRQNKMPAIPLSKNLCIVSVVHISDLLSLKPQDIGCSLHSWSDNGKWKGCCYGKQPTDAKCMSSKPNEITSYPGNGYELVYWEEETATAFEAFELWKQVPASMEMILNKGKWQSKSWKALGIGVRNGYAIIWLGDKSDLPANINICGSDTLVQKVQLVEKPVKVAVPSAEQNEKKVDVLDGKNENGITQSKEITYYVIVASLKTEALAQEKIKELNNKGYDNALLIGSGDKFRVSLGSFASEEKAKLRMKELKKTFPDCWIFKL
jgi:hypothetical protein